MRQQIGGSIGMPEINTQTQNPPPNSSVDLTKLKRVASGVLNASDADGLGDAFADVFAAMSVPQPVVATSSEPASEVEAPDEQEPVAESTETESDSDERQDSKPTAVQIESAEELVSVETGSIQTVDAQVSEVEVQVESDASPEAVVADVIAVESDAPDTTEVAAAEKIVGTEHQSVVSIKQEASKRESKPQSDKTVRTTEVAEKETASSVAKVETETTSTAETEVETTEFGFTNQSETDSDGNDGSRRRSHRDRSTNRVRDNANSGSTDNAVTEPNNNAAQSNVTSTKASAETSATPIDASAATTGTSPAPSRTIDASIAAIKSAAAATPVSSDAAKSGASNSARPAVEKPGDVSRLLDSAQKTTGNADSSKNTSKSHSTADILLRAKLVQRVSKAFQHFGNEGGNIRLKLAPAELGSVRVEMNVREKKVQARVVAETDSAARLLREQLPELRGRLEAQGMQIDQISIERDAGASADAQTTFDNGGSPQNGGSNTRDARQGREARPGVANNAVGNENQTQSVSVSHSPLHVGAGVDLFY